MIPHSVRISPRRQALLWGLIALGVGAFSLELFADPQSAWSSFLVSAIFYLSLALGGAVFLAYNYLGKAGWSTVLKRIAEGLTAYVPIGGLAMVALILGIPYLYPWASADHLDEAVAAKRAYLNLPFFAIRTIVFVGIWSLFSFLMVRNSRQQDEVGGVAPTQRNEALSAVFLFVFGITFSLASVDWMMSREPRWSSTIYGMYNLSGVLLGGTAAITVFAIALHRRGFLPHLTTGHVHDLAKYLFGFSTLWAYLWFSQYMLIWYANLSEETPYYLLRTSGGWSFLFYFNLVAGWLLPFIVLLPRRAKRSPNHVYRVALWILGARWLDFYLLSIPGGQPVHRGIGMVDVILFLAFGAAFLLTVTSALARAPLEAKRDPYFVEGVHHHT